MQNNSFNVKVKGYRYQPRLAADCSNTEARQVMKRIAHKRERRVLDRFTELEVEMTPEHTEEEIERAIHLEYYDSIYDLDYWEYDLDYWEYELDIPLPKMTISEVMRLVG